MTIKFMFIMKIYFISIYKFCQQNNLNNLKTIHKLLIILNKLLNYFCKMIA